MPSDYHKPTFAISQRRDAIAVRPLRIEAIVAAIDILETSPVIGRPVAFGQRKLVIATGSSGYLALYRYNPVLDTAFVLAVRGQRERDYKR